MCGINGFSYGDKSLILEMNSLLKHRGPDMQGVVVDSKMSLGHTRLSIIDLSEKGKQPMSYSFKGKKVIIAFNGEIYNFLEIKKDLIQKGFKFKSNTDTEVILASYLMWGENCVNKFNGMWAFCIYDLQKKLLFLSRDRLGKKPLYYSIHNDKFIFSSEIKPILLHKIKKELNFEALDLYFSLGFIPAPFTIYKNIFKVGARENILFDLKTKQIKKNYYFQYPKYAPIYDKKKLIKEGKFLLNDSIKLRLIGDVPLGVFLSGGVDSSSIVANINKTEFKSNLNTFSVGFRGKGDETSYINLIKTKFGINHFHKYFQDDILLKQLKEMFYFYDEPFADTSTFPMLLLSDFASDKIKIALSGDGGDEIFGGYTTHKIAAQINFLKKIPLFLRKLILFFIPKITSTKKLREGIRVSFIDDLSLLIESFWSDFYKPEIYKKLIRKKIKECLNLANGDLVESFILFDRYFKTLPDNFLCKVDRASMANSLEVRCPYLDYRFLEYSSKIPSKWKADLFRTKILLKQILKGMLPSKILNRKKQGFSPPFESWLNKNYFKKFPRMLSELFNHSLISPAWEDFYQKKVLPSKDPLFDRFKVRLFLYYFWSKTWILKNEV